MALLILQRAYPPGCSYAKLEQLYLQYLFHKWLSSCTGLSHFSLYNYEKWGTRLYSQLVNDLLFNEHTDFPYCTKFPIRSDLDLFTCAYFFFLGEEQIEAKVPVAGTVKRNLFRSMSNFWHKLVEKMKSIKQCLSSALVKFSLLLRCGDVEENPGPYDQEKDGKR